MQRKHVYYITKPLIRVKYIIHLHKKIHNPITKIAIKEDNKLDFTSAVQAFQEISNPIRLHWNLAQPEDLKGGKDEKEGGQT